MKTSALIRPACLAAILSLGGCFGGEDGLDDPAGPGGGPSVRKLSPGLYQGDYAPYASISRVDGVVESEFLLEADGSYRFFWFHENTPVVDIRGEWLQKDSNVHFTGVTESYTDAGVFYPGQPVEDDTNAIREVTETSFVRKEWSPLRQKPLWITYRKTSPARLEDGSFLYTEDFPVDSETVSYRIGVRLDGGEYKEDFLQTFGGDTTRAYLAEGGWRQIGSVLIIERFMGRFFDTATRAYGPDWDTLPGDLMYRIKDVSDSGYRMWSGTTWDEYRKN